MLTPYLIGDRPRENGEQDMFCPLHEDSVRSASINPDLGSWFCFAGCGGGSIEGLIDMKPYWVPPPSGSAYSNGSHRSRGKAETVNEAQISGWHSALMSNKDRLSYLTEHRMLEQTTLERYEIGWDSTRRVYTIPVRGPEDVLWNVRRYDPAPREGAPKIRSVTGMGSPPRLYPVSMFDQVTDSVIVGEGEWDTLLTIQHGYPCITRTAAADTWRSEWNPLFEGLTVYLAHDADAKGAVANRKVARALRRTARVMTVKLPYEFREKHGKDLSDFWADYDRERFEQMLSEAKAVRPDEENVEPEAISVLDSFDAARVGKPVRISVTIKGRREPGYTVPRKIHLQCSQDAGAKCNLCPLNSAAGDTVFEIAPENPRVLALLDVNQAAVMQNIAYEYGVPGGKCSRLTVEVDQHQAVEILLARPSLDQTDDSRADSYKNIKLTSVGRHDTLPNNTVDVIGALYAHPRTQVNEFLVWELERTQTSVDHFEITPEAVELMKIFRATHGRPLKKLREISDELSLYVTHILGRPEMHALMDLTFHSALGFNFARRQESRGWLDSLIIGDTRTGKSEAAAGLVRHYGAGEIIGGEMASVAGIIGGAQQINGREWMITWGAIPLNDMRLVVIDEASGLSHEEIAAMSDVRASGLAKITKITAEATRARARLLWLSNPRNARMSDFTYGVDAIRPLIGNNEDIARFDLAMAVSLGDVAAEIINTPPDPGTLTYTSEACHAMVLWAWTRKPDQIVWANNSESTVLAAANEMGRRYVEDPPLVQAANIRLKIARVAVALAARLFSTDSTHENVLVRPEHVEDAVVFMDRLYSMGVFGYAERSRERISDAREAQQNVDDIREYLNDRPGLAKFLRNHAKFRRQDLEEILDVSREEANGTINALWEARMVRKEQADIRVEPTLHELLRGL